MPDQSTIDRLDRRLVRLEQDARSGRPVNVTTPRKSDANFVRFGNLEHSPGVSGDWPQFIPDGAASLAILPTFSYMVPFLPTTNAELRTRQFEYGVMAFSNDGLKEWFALDASQTGNSIDLYFYRCLGQNLSRAFVCTLNTSTDLGGTESYYWKGGLPPPGYHDCIDTVPDAGTLKITSGMETYTITAMNALAKIITVGDNLTGKATPNSTITIESGANAGTYTVQTSVFSNGSTIITINESIPTPSALGTITYRGKLLWNEDDYDLYHARVDFDTSCINVIRDDSSKDWRAYFGSGIPLSFTAGQTLCRFWQDTAHPCFVRNLPIIQDLGKLLIEHIPAACIPKGHYALELWGDGTAKLRIRYRHHTTGTYYEGAIDLPNTKPERFDPYQRSWSYQGGDPYNDYGLALWCRIDTETISDGMETKQVWKGKDWTSIADNLPKS